MYHYVLMCGTWSVRFDHHEGADRHVNLVDEIVAARHAARARWEAYGLPSGVVFESPEGTDIEDEVYG